MLDGGLPAGSVTMIHGAPGSGKTSLGMSFLNEGAQRGERGLLLWILRDPRRSWSPRPKKSVSPPARWWTRSSSRSPGTPPFDTLADKLAHQLLAIVREQNISRVFIDGMRGFNQSLVQPKRARVFVAALANELRARGIIAIFAEEKTSLADDHLPEHGLASSLDNIIFLQHVKSGDRLHKGHLHRQDAQTPRTTRRCASSSFDETGFTMAPGPTPAAGNERAHGTTLVQEGRRRSRRASPTLRSDVRVADEDHPPGR